MAKKNIAKSINQMSKFEATMLACQRAKAKTLKESSTAKRSIKKSIKSNNRKVESAIKKNRRMVEEEEYDPEVDDVDLPEDTATDAVIVVDPELDTDEYEANLDDLQAIIDETPEGEVPSTEEYVNDYVYTCPICGNNFFADTEMGADEECPVCGEVVDEFILVGGVESPSEALGSEDEEMDDVPEDDMGDEDLDLDAEIEEELDVDTDTSDVAECKKNSKKESYKYMINEKTVNPFLTKFIKENYKNASSMSVVSATIAGNRIKMECVIKFKSGSTKKTTVTLENFRPSVRPTSIVGKADNAFKVESKKAAPFTFEAFTKNNVIRFTGMKYSFITKKEGKSVQIYGKYALKESAKRNFRQGRR